MYVLMDVWMGKESNGSYYLMTWVAVGLDRIGSGDYLYKRYIDWVAN